MRKKTKESITFYIDICIHVVLKIPLNMSYIYRYNTSDFSTFTSSDPSVSQSICQSTASLKIDRYQDA